MSSFDTYQGNFPDARLIRSKTGVLEVAVHTDGSTLAFNGNTHEQLLPRVREIAEALAKLPSLTTKYTRIAMTQKLRHIIDEGVALGLALGGSAPPMSRGRNE